MLKLSLFEAHGDLLLKDGFHLVLIGNFAEQNLLYLPARDALFSFENSDLFQHHSSGSLKSS